jgi:hypothetical protein
VALGLQANEDVQFEPRLVAGEEEEDLCAVVGAVELEPDLGYHVVVGLAHGRGVQANGPGDDGPVGNGQSTPGDAFGGGCGRRLELLATCGPVEVVHHDEDVVDARAFAGPGRGSEAEEGTGRARGDEVGVLVDVAGVGVDALGHSKKGDPRRHPELDGKSAAGSCAVKLKNSKF